MNKLFKLIYLILILTLNFSCVEKKSSEKEISKLEFVNSSKTDTFKFTSGIRSICQDRKGNYWLGSHKEGVAKFDGDKFTYFTINDGLSDNQITYIQEDQNGVIWFGTGNGICNFKDGIIENPMSNNVLTGLQTITKGDWFLTENDLWFDAGKEFGAYRYDGQNLSYLEFPVQGVTNAFNPYCVTGFSKGKNGNLWVATYAAVFEYDGKSFEITDDKSLGYSKETGLLHIRSILEDSKGNLWVGNNGIGVLLKDSDSIINFSEQNNLIHPTSSRRGDKSPAGTLEHVFVIEEDSEGNIWFGDRDTGAWKFDGKTMTNFIIDKKLSTPMIWSIYNDNNTNLLFGMADGGVYKFNGKSFDKMF